jgi:DNA-binding transcriptional LysR family regulator
LELRVLRYFLAVARENNFTKAAELLRVTQPTLSRQIGQLEEELGVKLFKRSNHGINLTEEGTLLRSRAREIVALVDKTQNELTAGGERLSGEIAIGSGELRSVAGLSDSLATFREKHPGVRLEIFSGNADDVKDRLDKGLLDFGLLLEPVDVGKYEYLRLPGSEIWGVLTPKDSLWAEKKGIEPEDLVGQPLFFPNRPALEGPLANWFGDMYDSLNIVAGFNLIYNVAIMAQRKMGLVVCIKLDAVYENLTFVPLKPKLEAGSLLVWKKNQTGSRASKAFLEHTRNNLKAL